MQPVEFDQCPTGVISVLLNLTHNCNLACRYCIMSMPALRQGYQQRPVSMDPTLVRQSIDYIRQVGLKGTNITFYGGDITSFSALFHSCILMSICHEHYFVSGIRFSEGTPSEIKARLPQMFQAIRRRLCRPESPLLSLPVERPAAQCTPCN